MDGDVARTTAMNITYIIFVGKPEGRRRHVKPGHNCNILKTGFRMSSGFNGGLV
jgi:hypothetical protein